MSASVDKSLADLSCIALTAIQVNITPQRFALAGFDLVPLDILTSTGPKKPIRVLVKGFSLINILSLGRSDMYVVLALTVSCLQCKHSLNICLISKIVSNKYFVGSAFYRYDIMLVSVIIMRLDKCCDFETII